MKPETLQHAVELLRFGDEEDVRLRVDNLDWHRRPALTNLLRCGDGPVERRIDEERGAVQSVQGRAQIGRPQEVEIGDQHCS